MRKFTKKHFLVSYLLLSISIVILGIGEVYCQVGIGTTIPDEKSQLDVTSTSKGILIPRLTNTQRNNIRNPPEGLMIYNISTNNYNLYDGTSWKAMQKELPSGVQILSDTGQ
jgi:hypothetical protein